MSLQAPAVDRPSASRQPLQLLASVLSLRYFLLRASTAAAALAFGLVQTFVFARVFGAQEFSVYILIGTFGVSLWLFDLGAAKILFVRQRERHLAASRDGAVPAQSSAVVVLYAALVLVGTLVCFGVMAARRGLRRRARLRAVFHVRRAQPGLVPAAQRQQCRRRIYRLRDARGSAPH